ncbi:protein FAR1-RELATED SEQUENCE 5-like [Apium graveolens]|uniref:protein FAR1-RELATED SEQUENCE 5-like n=1 Tax=Apium graveolens TaxID=4045 RepID=UPI003D7BA1B7
MTNVEESAGSECYPHIESSDSEQSGCEQDSDKSQCEQDSGGETGSESSDEDLEESHNDNECESTYFVAADGSEFWTPKCDNRHKPQTNQYFPTLEDAFKFYKEYGRVCGFCVRKSIKRTSGRGTLLSRYVICNRGGKPNRSNSKVSNESAGKGPKKTRRTTSRRCNCKARIILKPAGTGGLVVMGFNEEHNHPLSSGAEKMFLKCNRNLFVPHQNLIMDCARVNIGATKAFSLAKEWAGSYEAVGAMLIDFKNFARDVKARIGKRDSDMILAKFKLKKEASQNTFYYDYKVDRQGHLTGLFWTDAIGQANFDVFGDIISFDPTFRTNRYNMVFVPFTGVNNHWKNVTFAAGLLAKENYKNFNWLINTFKKAMGRAPRCVITDQCPAIKKALDKWWPNTKHRLCMWHIMNKLPTKVGPALASDKKFIEKLKSAVYSDHITQTEFVERWNAVIVEYKLESNPWLTELFNIRNEWIPAYFSDIEMAGLLRTTSRSESSNSFFQHFHESGHTLVEFYSSFESAMDKQRLKNAEDDKRSGIEIDASKLYTLELYYLVREEIKAACYHTSMPDITRDNEHRYFKVKDDLLHDRIFEVYS